MRHQGSKGRDQGVEMLRRRAPLAALSAVILVTAGCATYHPLVLPVMPRFPEGVPHLEAHPGGMPLPELGAQLFDPSDGLDMTEVAMLAVAHNPELNVARDASGVSRAQAFAAGLLPDPVLAGTRDVPTNGDATNTTGFSAGISYDINALLTHSAVKQAAQATRRQTDLNLLWLEWMVVAKARLLFTKGLAQQKLLAVLEEERSLAASRHASLQEALAGGDATLDAVAADLVEVQNLDTQINDLSRRTNANRQDLNALLGLAPETRLRLTGGIQIPPLDEEAIRSAMADLNRRRPDLLALQAGYESQEQRFRQSVLAQFPVLNIRLTRARDTSGLYTRGLGITLSLPIFNGNRGNIAIEKATRLRLRDEYQMRLNAAYGDIFRILEDQKLLEAQLREVASGISALAQPAEEAKAAFASGDMDELVYTQIRIAWLNKRAEGLAIEQALLEQRVILQALVGGELPFRTPPHRAPSAPKESLP